MGTGVMIGAGIFALTGQIAELSGPLFPPAFLIGAVISGFSAYAYIKVSNEYPSAGGIAMILKKSYGPTTITGAAALLAEDAALPLIKLIGRLSSFSKKGCRSVVDNIADIERKQYRCDHEFLLHCAE